MESIYHWIKFEWLALENLVLGFEVLYQNERTDIIFLLWHKVFVVSLNLNVYKWFIDSKPEDSINFGFGFLKDRLEVRLGKMPDRLHVFRYMKLIQNDFYKFHRSRDTHFILELHSEDEEYPSVLIIGGLSKLCGFKLYITMPRWLLKPANFRNQYPYSDKVLVKYGINIFDNFVLLSYGPDTMDSSTTKTFGWHMPWADTTFIRHTLYAPDRTISIYNVDKFDYDERKRREASISEKYSFKDYDGEEITATVFIEEREWHWGTKWCKWLKYVTKPIIRTDIEVNAEKEVGDRKGSWKGGWLGAGGDILPNETIEDAFKRFAEKHNLTDVKKVELKEGELLQAFEEELVKQKARHAETKATESGECVVDTTK